MLLLLTLTHSRLVSPTVPLPLRRNIPANGKDAVVAALLLAILAFTSPVPARDSTEIPLSPKLLTVLLLMSVVIFPSPSDTTHTAMVAAAALAMMVLLRM